MYLLCVLNTLSFSCNIMNSFNKVFQKKPLFTPSEIQHIIARGVGWGVCHQKVVHLAIVYQIPNQMEAGLVTLSSFRTNRLISGDPAPSPGKRNPDGQPGHHAPAFRLDRNSYLTSWSRPASMDSHGASAGQLFSIKSASQRGWLSGLRGSSDRLGMDADA